MNISSNFVQRNRTRYGLFYKIFNVLSLWALSLWFGLVLTTWPLPVAAQQVTIVALGDSLVAGYGLAEQDAFSAQLEQALKTYGLDARVINAGVSGDTMAGGLERLDWVLADTPDLVLVALGANDGLRGLDPAVTRAHLDTILTRLNARGVSVLLTGMMAPPNLGRDYSEQFNAIYPDMAAKHHVPLDPFFLEGVATNPQLNQADGIHPNAAGVALIVKRLAPQISHLLAHASPNPTQSSP